MSAAPAHHIGGGVLSPDGSAKGGQPRSGGHAMGNALSDERGRASSAGERGGVRVDAAPDQWVATLAHELRTPLGAILMALDELRPLCTSEPLAREVREEAES